MNRRINTVALAAVALLIATPSLQAQGALKIATIDSKVLLEKLPGRAEIEAALQKELAPLEARLKQMQDSNVAITNKHMAEASKLPDSVRAAREKEIIEKRKVWDVKADSIDMLAGKRREAIEGPMTALIKKVIDEIRAEDGYLMVIDLAQAGPLIVAVDKNIDITDRVLAKYRIAAATLPKPGAPGGAGSTGTGVGGVRPPPSPDP